MRRRQFLCTLGAASAGWWIPARAAESFQPLFDGKSLAGWHKTTQKNGHGTGGRWGVEGGGVLAGEQDPPGSGNGGILLSDETFGDFELELEMHPDWGPDTGVFFRCNEAGEGLQVHGGGGWPAGGKCRWRNLRIRRL